MEPRRGRVLDLDDLLIEGRSVETTPASPSARWRFRHLYVDEFQDVNPAQLRLLTALLETGSTSSRSAIRTRRSTAGTAPIPLIDRLPELAGHQVLRLDANHRSTPQVMAAAGAARVIGVATPARGRRR